MSKVSNEEAFESAIESHLLANGWAQGVTSDYEKDLGLDPVVLLEFVKATQPKAWDRLVGLRGGEEKARPQFVKRVADELDARGTIAVLRDGVEDKCIEFKLAYFAPASHATPELWDLYAANVLTVTRQLHHSESRPNDSLDLVLSVNGLPTSTTELKNEFTGQGVEHARRQYEQDRNPVDLIFRARTIVHFAVDPNLVFMTTKLAGEKTRWLPFNQGSGGPGQKGGKGNPPSASAYRTRYLFEEVWQRDNWLLLLGSFVQAQLPETKARTKGGKGKTAKPVKTASRAKSAADLRIIFPRYHQWDAVQKIVGHVRGHGPGRSYLTEHSTGSGKSNTISWLAHRLSELHTPVDEAALGEGAKAVGLGTDEPIFNKVIVITDRVVLDRALQKTIQGFDHTPGVVVSIGIGKTTKDLRKALTSTEARIVITTLQKFPVIAEETVALAGSRFAIILDEAHSSQSGMSALKLQELLGGLSGDAALTAAESAEAMAEAAEEDGQDLMAKVLESRGTQKNLSFFAFTATPKQKTLQLFGEHIQDAALPSGERLEPFHLYSMRQAVDEGFIIDVLEHYLTYDTYYRLANGIGEDDPEIAKGKAASTLARFASLHPVMVAQKAEIIVEHFKSVTATKIGGHAKAMVVTRSRLHAVRFKMAIDAYIAKMGYRDISALVAFSGHVIDPDSQARLTEASMNDFGESQLPKKFDSDDYQVLVVAEKYQTGFDQPLLHTMYVDKKLDGVKAVQTLSRLNRIHPGKVDTFVLDFANTAADIREAYEPFFESTWAEPVDPNLLSNLKTRLTTAGILDPAEIADFVDALLTAKPSAHEALYAKTDLCKARWEALDEDDREDFRTALRDYVRLYGFLARILEYINEDMERLYQYGYALITRLPKDVDDHFLDLSDAAVLTHLRVEKGTLENISLSEVTDAESQTVGVTGAGHGKEHDQPTERLSQIILALNNRFGTICDEADALFVVQVEKALGENERAQSVALGNDFDQFMTVFDKIVENAMIDRQTANNVLVTAFLDKPGFRETVTELLGKEFYTNIRTKAGQRV